MQSKWMPKLSCAFALAAACNGLAGIDERETSQASGGRVGAVESGGRVGAVESGGRSSRASGASSGTPDSTSSAAAANGAGASVSAGTGAGVGGAGGDGGSTQSGGSSSGGVEASGGTRSSTGGTRASTGGGASTGGKGGNASTGGKGGNASTGGKGGNLSAGAGGSTNAGPCLGYANELDTTGWYIDTGFDETDGSRIEPRATDDSGLFQKGECACVTGSRNSYADLYFQNKDGVRFNTLDLKLISLPDFAIPTIYVYTKPDGKKHCLVLTPDEESAVNQGETLQFSSARFHNGSDCNRAELDLKPDSLIDEVELEFNKYETQGRTDFDLCVLKLTVH